MPQPKKNSLSLNDGLEMCPPSVQYCFVGTLKKLFHKSDSGNEKKNALKLHWVKNQDPSVIEINIFSRLVFSLRQLSFPLECTLKEHFNNSKQEYRNVIEIIKNDLNVDDSVLGE